MVEVYKNLIIDISTLHNKFYTTLVHDLKPNINYSSKQLNHLQRDTVLSDNFIQYVTTYKKRLTKFVSSEEFDEIETKYNEMYLRTRVKELDSLEEKINRYTNGHEKGKIPIQKCVNDMLGFRVISDKDLRYDSNFKSMCEEMKKKNNIYRYYVRNHDNYHGIHLYFKSKSNLYLPWELQIWYTEHERTNYQSHLQHKQAYLQRGE